MTKRLLFTALLLTVCSAAAQNPTVYFMEGTPLRSHLNPAFAPLRGYVNIPAVGNIDVNASGNIAIDKILYPRNGKLVTIFDNAVTAADALADLRSNNLTGVDTRVNLIGFGAFRANGKSFWSFDLNARAVANIQLPYELFDFLKNGTTTRINNISTTTDSYLEAGFNYSFPLLNDKLYIGLRGKFLLGMARARMNYNRFDVRLDADRWLIEAEGTLDITAAGTDVSMRTDDNMRDYYNIHDISLRPTKPSGYGFAVDLGASYDILPNLQASLAVNDLGFIAWGKGHNRSGISAKTLEFTGVEIDKNGIAGQPKFDIDILQFMPEAPQSTTRMLQASINAGVQYKVWRQKIGLGVLYTARIWEFQTLHNLTGSVNFQPIDWFTLSASYSVIDNRAHAVGVAMNLCPGWIHFFVATDMLIGRHTPQFLPIRQNMLNLTLGLGIPIGRRSERPAARTAPAVGY